MKSTIVLIAVLQQAWDELKASLIIAYPNLEGLGEWEPASLIFLDAYQWENINTNQIDVLSTLQSIWIRKIQPCGGQGRNCNLKNY